MILQSPKEEFFRPIINGEIDFNDFVVIASGETLVMVSKFSFGCDDLMKRSKNIPKAESLFELAGIAAISSFRFITFDYISRFYSHKNYIYRLFNEDKKVQGYEVLAINHDNQVRTIWISDVDFEWLKEHNGQK